MKVCFRINTIGYYEVPENMEAEVMKIMKGENPMNSNQLFELLDNREESPCWQLDDHAEDETGEFFIESDEGDEVYRFMPKNLTLDTDESGDVFLCQRFSVVQKLSLTTEHVKMWKEESEKNPNLTLDEFYHMIGGNSWHWDHDTQQEQVELKPYLSNE